MSRTDAMSIHPIFDRPDTQTYMHPYGIPYSRSTSTAQVQSPVSLLNIKQLFQQYMLRNDDDSSSQLG